MKSLIKKIRSKFKRKPILTDFYLNQYVKKTCATKMDDCESILGSREGLRAFADFWKNNKEELSLMLTSIEYEFLHGQEFTKDELAALRHAVGNVSLFFQYSHRAYEEVKMEQAKGRN